MKRTIKPAKSVQIDRLPDAVNASPQGNFTMVPNRVLKSPEISAKAKIILFILLSNRQGWYSYKSTISGMMMEGEQSIITGIKQLKDAGYLQIIKYRDKKTKTYKGAFWAYTTTPNQFNFDENIRFLNENNLELINTQPIDGKPVDGKPVDGKPVDGNPGLIILNNNNTNNNKTKVMVVFEQFWELYPKKIDKGKALTAWNKASNKKVLPSWNVIHNSIIGQSQTNRWKDGYIPNPATWINQMRWLDDPAGMNNDDRKTNKTTIGHHDPNVDYKAKYGGYDEIR